MSSARTIPSKFHIAPARNVEVHGPASRQRKLAGSHKSRIARPATTLKSSIAIDMELRRAADTLLRTQSSLSFLTPSVSTRWQPGLRSSSNGSRNRQVQRTFTSSSRYSALPTGKNPTTEAKPAATTPETPAPSWTKGASPNRLSSPSRIERTLNGGSSADLILDSINKMRGSSSSKFDLERMKNPLPERHDVGDIMRSISETVAAPPPPKQPMRLVPATGRTVALGTGVDIGRALRLLEQSCARNKVRSDFTRQRFHERGGLKRKRLRRERWRKKFKTGFKQYVDRVKVLKKQGW